MTVTNTGIKPAQEVHVRIEPLAGDTTETATFTPELLAAEASKEGAAVFTNDLSAGEIRAVVESFL